MSFEDVKRKYGISTGSYEEVQRKYGVHPDQIKEREQQEFFNSVGNEVRNYATEWQNFWNNGGTYDSDEYNRLVSNRSRISNRLYDLGEQYAGNADAVNYFEQLRLALNDMNEGEDALNLQNNYSNLFKEFQGVASTLDSYSTKINNGEWMSAEDLSAYSAASEEYSRIGDQLFTEEFGYTPEEIQGYKNSRSASLNLANSAYGIYKGYANEEAYNLERDWNKEHGTVEARQDWYSGLRTRKRQLSIQMEEELSKATTPSELFEIMRRYGNMIDYIDAEMSKYERGETNEYGFSYGNKTLDEYYGLIGNDDFYINSQRKSEAGNAPREDVLGVYNDIKGGRSGNADIWAAGTSNNWDSLGSDEVQLYYYIGNTKGWDKAEEFLYNIGTTLDKRATEKNKEEWQAAYDEAGLLEKAWMSIKSVPANVFSGVIGTIENIASYVGGRDINPYSSGQQGMHYANTVRGATSEDLDRLTGYDPEKGTEAASFLGISLSDLYQSTMSRADSTLSIALFGGTGGSAVLGMGAAQNKAYDLYRSGASANQILIGSLAAGAAEMVFEKYAFGKLKELDDVSGFGGWIKNMAVQGVNEFIEEAETEIANVISDYLVMGRQSDLIALLNENNGDWGDTGIALLKQFYEAGASGFIGGVQAGTMQSVKSKIKTNAYNKAIGKEIIKAGGVETLKGMTADGTSSRSINKLSSKVTDADSRRNAKNVGQLYGEVTRSIGKKNANANAADVAQALQDGGISTADASRLANAIIAQQNGTATEKQNKLLDKFAENDTVHKVMRDIVLNQDSTVGQRSKSIREFGDAVSFVKGINKELDEADMRIVAQKLRDGGIEADKVNAVAVALAAVHSGVATKEQKRLLKKFKGNEAVANANQYLQDAAENKLTVDTYKAMLDRDGMIAESKSAESTGAETVSEAVDEEPSVSVDGKTFVESTGKVADSVSFQSIGADGVTLNVDGTNTKMDDVSFGTEKDYADAKRISKVEAMTPAVANEIWNNPNREKERFVTEAVRAFRAGVRNDNQVLDRLDSDVISKKDAESLFKKGREVATGKANVENAEVKAKGTGKTGKKTGGVYYGYEGKTIDQREGKLTRKQKVAVEFAKRMAGKFGANYYFYESYEDKNGNLVFKDKDGNVRSAEKGFYDPSDGSIHVSLSAENTLFVVSHELVHFIRDWSPVRFKQMADLVMEGFNRQDISAEELVYLKQAEYAKNGIELTEEQAFEEVIAAALEDVIAGDRVQEFMMEAEGIDKSLGAKIKKFFQDICDLFKEILDVYKNVRSDSPEASVIHKMEDIYQKLQRALVRGVYEAGTNFQKAENTTMEGGVRYLGRDKNNNVVVDEDVDPKKVRMTLTEIYNGNYQNDNNYFPVLKNTPEVYRMYCHLDADRSFVMAKKKAYKAMQQKNKKQHALGVDGLMYVIENLGTPDYIVYQNVGEYAGNYAAIIISEEREIFAAVQLGEYKDSPYAPNGEKGYYNTLITAFYPNDGYIDNNILIPENDIVYDKEAVYYEKEDPLQVASGVTPSDRAEESSNKTVPQKSAVVKSESISNENSTEYKINTSMTMAEAKRMIETAYKVNGIAEYYEGEYTDAEDWLRKAGADEVEMYIENDYDLQAKYINSNEDILNEEYRMSDILEAYLAGTLVGKEKPKPKRLDVSQSTNLNDNRFYSPQKIEEARTVYDLAIQKAVGKNSVAVNQARAKILLFAHNKGAAELLGITQSELNKKLRSWSNYSATAREISTKINAGVAEENRWTGIENSAYISKASVTNEDIERMVASVEGDSKGYERKYIARVMLAADTHIDYSGLKFKFASSQQVNADNNSGGRVLGFYDDTNRLIEVTHDKPNTVAHEMGHYIDAQWGRDLIGTNSSHLFLTRGVNADMVRDRFGDPGVQFLNNFKLFINSLSDVNQNYNSYYNDRSEIFARFFARFIEWTDNIATGNKHYSYESTMYNDKFTQAQFVEFARLLQEKALLDGIRVASTTDSAQATDIRYSVGAKTDKAVQKMLETENQKLQEDVAKLKDLLKLQSVETGGTKFLETSVLAAARYLKKNSGTSGNTKELAGMLNDFYEYIATGKDLTWEDIREQALPIANWIMDNVEHGTNEYFQEILDQMHGTEFRLTDEQMTEAVNAYGSYNDFRRALSGAVKVSKNSTGKLEAWWQEMSTLYPDMFAVDEIAANMPVALADVVNRLKNDNTSALEYAYNKRWIEQDLIRDIYDSYWRVSNLRTVADRYAAQRNKLISEHHQRIDNLKADNREKMDQLREQHRAEVEMIRKDYEQKSEKERKQLAEKYKESRAKAVESRNKTEMRHKIRKTIKELKTLLNRGDKKRNVKEEMQDVVAKAIDVAEYLFNNNVTDEDIIRNGFQYEILTYEQEKIYEEAYELVKKLDDAPAGSMDAMQIKSWLAARKAKLKDSLIKERMRMEEKSVKSLLDDLAEAYISMENSENSYISNSTDNEVYQHIKNVADTLKGAKIASMTTKQLDDVYEVYRMVLETVRNANKSFVSTGKETISERATRVISEVKKAGGTHADRVSALDGVKRFGWNNMKPVYAFEEIGSNALTTAFNNVRNGEDVWALDVTAARAFYLRLSKEYGFDKWDMDKSYTFTATSGQEFQLTLQQMMSLYAYSKREQADEHLRLGGFVFDSNIEFKKEKGKDGKKHTVLKYKKNTADAHQIDLDTMQEIVKTVSEIPGVKDFVDGMQDYLSTTMGAKGNEVSMKMYGIKLFKEKNYFPLKSAKQFLFEQNQVSGEVRIKNSGFTNKLVAGANNPIILSDFMDVWCQHVNDMSMYHAFTLPLEDFNRIFNFTTGKAEGMAPKSVKGTIQDAYGPAANAYIKQLITDLNGGAVTDPREITGQKLMGKWKKAKVMASLSVVIQQPTSIARAFAMIDPKYFVGKKTGLSNAESWEELKKYAPVAIIKEMGYFDTGMGLGVKDFIQQKEYEGLKEKAKGVLTDSNYRDEVLGKAPAKADEITWVAIWNAVKRETAGRHPELKPGTEEYLKAAGERFTEVITKTQVYDSVLARSAHMRSKSGWMNMVTAFMAEPTTTINMAIDAVVKASRGDKKGAFKIMKAVVICNIINNALASLVYAMRDDDEEETFLEKYMQSLSTGLIDDINPMTYFPWLKDVWSVVQGYSVDRSDMSLISDIANAGKGLYKAYDKDKNLLQAWLDFAGSVGNFAGFPLENMIREGYAFANTWKTHRKDWTERDTTWSSLGDAIGDALANSAPVYGLFADDSKVDDLYDAIIDGDKKYLERLKSGYADKDGNFSESKYNTALKNALRENDDRIQEAAQARIDGDFVRYSELLNEIKDEGKFDHAIIRDAIYAEEKDLRDEDSEVSEKEADAYVSSFTQDDYFSAVFSGNTESAEMIYQDLLDDKLAEGYLQHEAKDAIASAFATEVGNRYLDGEITRAQAVKLLEENTDKGEAEVKKWDFELKFGFAWGNRARKYRTEKISRSDLEKWVMDIDGADRAEAKAYVDFLDLEMANPNTNITAADAESFFEHAEPAGIDIDTYVEFKDKVSTIKGEIDPKTGKTKSGSKKANVLKYIHSLPLTVAQKDALYYAQGYPESTIKDAPWH